MDLIQELKAIANGDDPTPIGVPPKTNITGGQVHLDNIEPEQVTHLAKMQDFRRTTKYCEMCGNSEREAQATMLLPQEMSHIFKRNLNLDEHTALVMHLCWPCHRNMLKVSAHEIAMRQRGETARLRAKEQGDERPEFPEKDQVDEGILNIQQRYDATYDFEDEVFRRHIENTVRSINARRL